MKVYTRPRSPYWYVDLPINGRRRRLSLRLLAVGRGAVKRRVAERAAEELQDQHKDAGIPRTLKDAIESYIAHLKDRGVSSARNAAALGDKLLGHAERFPGRWHLDPLRGIASLTTSDTRTLAERRRAEGNAPQTIKHELALLRAAVRYAAGDGAVLPPLTSGSVRNAWAIPSVPEKTRYLSWEEFLRLYDYLDPTRDVVVVRKGKSLRPYKLAAANQAERLAARDLLVGLTMTGGRWSEVAALTWDRVDLDAGVGRLYGTKTEAERLVPLPPQFLEVLRRRKAEATGRLVFPGRDGGQRAGPSQAIRRAIAACGLNDHEDQVARYGRATIHSLRHTFASWLLQHGAGIAEVQDALGHSSLTMTRRYAHLSRSKTAAKLGGILAGIGVPGDDPAPR